MPNPDRQQGKIGYNPPKAAQKNPPKAHRQLIKKQQQLGGKKTNKKNWPRETTGEEKCANII